MDRHTTTALDRWITTQPEQDDDLITCPACETPLFADALRWGTVKIESLPVWGCSGITEVDVAAGYIAGCGEDTAHGEHVALDDVTTETGTCPVCTEPLTRTT